MLRDNLRSVQFGRPSDGIPDADDGRRRGAGRPHGARRSETGSLAEKLHVHPVKTTCTSRKNYMYIQEKLHVHLGKTTCTSRKKPVCSHCCHMGTKQPSRGSIDIGKTCRPSSHTFGQPRGPSGGPNAADKDFLRLTPSFLRLTPRLA